MATLDQSRTAADAGSAEDARYRAVSFWHDTAPGNLDRRAPLPGDV